MKKINKIISNKWSYLFFAPLVIFSICAFFSVGYIISLDTHFTVVPVVQSNSELDIPQSDLIDGKVVKGKFVASRNNLGAIALRVQNLHNEQIPDNYQIFFRLKEKDAKTWYSSNSYHGGQFHELEIFPFGFNSIADSKGKTYEFELYSKGAKEFNALTIEKNQKIVGQYQISKSNLKNPIVAIDYIFGKLLYIFNNVGDLFSALIYFLPLYGYFFLLAEKDTVAIPAFVTSILLFKFVRKIIVGPVVKIVNFLLKVLNRYGVVEEYKPVKIVSLFNIVLFVTILVEIFLIVGTNNLLLLLILLLWAITIYVHTIQFQVNFIFALGFLLLCFFLYILGLDNYSEKAAIWAYLFLILGAIQQFQKFSNGSDGKTT